MVHPSSTPLKPVAAVAPPAIGDNSGSGIWGEVDPENFGEHHYGRRIFRRCSRGRRRRTRWITTRKLLAIYGSVEGWRSGDGQREHCSALVWFRRLTVSVLTTSAGVSKPRCYGVQDLQENHSVNTHTRRIRKVDLVNQITSLQLQHDAELKLICDPKANLWKQQVNG